MNEDKINIPGVSGTFRNMESVDVATVHESTEQELVVTTVDRLRLRLVEHVDAVQKKHAWMIPLAVFLPIMVSVVTTEFRDFVLEASVWKAIFIIVGVFSLCWFLFELRNARKSISVDDLVEKIKKNNKG